MTLTHCYQSATIGNIINAAQTTALRENGGTFSNDSGIFNLFSTRSLNFDHVELSTWDSKGREVKLKCRIDFLPFSKYYDTCELRVVEVLEVTTVSTATGFGKGRGRGRNKKSRA